MQKIYGIDLNQKITPLMVRDALVECFYQAHCQDTGLLKEGEAVSRDYCQDLVKKMFKESEDDFERPTEEALLRAMTKLANFALNFRKPRLVKKYYDAMMILIKKISN